MDSEQPIPVQTVETFTVTQEQVDLMNRTWREGFQREKLLRSSLEEYIAWQTELVKEINAGREREMELQQKCSSLEASAEEWRKMFDDALKLFKQVDYTPISMETGHASHLAATPTEGEKLPYSPKDVQIHRLQAELALNKKKQMRRELEMEYEVKSTTVRSIKALQEVTQRILEFTVDVEESQPGQKYGCPTINIPSEIPRQQPQEVPAYLRSNPLESRKFECLDSIRCAYAALVDAAKNWKDAQKGIVSMQSVLRKEIVDIIVGNKELDP